MTKDPRDMTNTEEEEWRQKCAENARSYLFSIGQPLVYRATDGRMMIEYMDGQVLPVQ